MKLNRKGVAECFGCSLPTVDAWVKDGLPVEVEGSRGVEWRFDSFAVHEWLVKQAKAGRRTRGNRFGEGGEQPSEGKLTVEEAKRRHEIAKMKTAELELAEAMGAVAPVAVLSKVISDEIGKARARLLAIPSKFRPTALMHAAKAEKAQKLVDTVDELVRDALAQIKADGAGGEK